MLLAWMLALCLLNRIACGVSADENTWLSGKEGEASQGAFADRRLANATSAPTPVPTPVGGVIPVGGMDCYADWQCGYQNANWNEQLVRY